MPLSSLNIHFFGTMRVTAAGRPVDVGSPRARSLFAYLVLHHADTLDRRRVAFQFWPRTTETAARRNLRQYLHRIRKALEPIDPHGRLLATEGHHLQFCPPDTWFLDTAAFETAAENHAPDQLEKAIALYTGDLLNDLYDDWLTPERDRLARVYRDTLLRLIDHLAKTADDRARAIKYAHQYITAEPLLETGYLRLMKLHYAAGDRGRVKQTYDQLRHTLAEELDAQPLAETDTIFQAMMAGTYGQPDHETAPPVSAVDSRPDPALPVPADPIPPQPETAGPLIGRTADLAWLNDAWTAAADGRGTFRLITGESGIGKTRLVTEWMGRHTDAYIFTGRSYEFENMIPYSPLAHALRDGFDLIDWTQFQPPPPWMAPLRSLLPTLADRLPGSTDAAPGRHHIIQSISALLLTLARRRPVILFLDNLHWADAATWNFLGYLAQRAAGTRLLIIGTARQEDTTTEQQLLMRKLTRRQWLHTRPLTRLAQNETAALVNAIMADPADPRFVRRIYEETEGNPFFIIETVQAVREAGGDWTESMPTDEYGRRPTFAIPLEVQAVIESRLDKLDEAGRAALGVAAAIGRAFTFALLQEVSQTTTQNLLNYLDEWLARGLVRETRDGYDFTHEKLGRVAYGRLSRARRQWIHHQIADYLLAQPHPPDPAQIAHHFYQSDDPARALPYLARAGRRALRVRSYREAREFGLRAIGLIGRFPRLTQITPAERMDLNVQLAQAYAFTGAHGRAQQLLRETERIAQSGDDAERLTDIFYRSAQIFWLQGEPETADRYARRMMRHAEEGDDDELRLAALRMLARTNITRSHYDDAIAYLLRGIDLAEKTAAPELPVMYGYLGVAYARVGSWQRAIDAARQGVELTNDNLPGQMHIVARMQLAFVHAELREWSAALEAAEPVRDLWREEGMTPHAFMLRAVIGRCSAHQKHASTEQRRAAGPVAIASALEWANEVDHRVLVHGVYLYLAQAHYAVGDYDAAYSAAGSAYTAADRVGDRWAAAVALRTRAESAMRHPKPQWTTLEKDLIRAAQILRRIRARPDLARTYLTMRRLYDRAGQVAWAVDCHFRAITIFEELGMGTERQQAQGKPAGERTGAVVIPGLELLGPNVDADALFDLS